MITALARIANLARKNKAVGLLGITAAGVGVGVGVAAARDYQRNRDVSAATIAYDLHLRYCQHATWPHTEFCEPRQGDEANAAAVLLILDSYGYADVAEIRRPVHVGWQ